MFNALVYNDIMPFAGPSRYARLAQSGLLPMAGANKRLPRARDARCRPNEQRHEREAQRKSVE